MRKQFNQEQTETVIPCTQSPKKKTKIRSKYMQQQDFCRINMTVCTWTKQSHGLFDYQSEPDKNVTQEFVLQNSCRIARGKATKRTHIRELPSQNEGVNLNGSILDKSDVFSLNYNAKTRKFTLNSLLIKDPGYSCQEGSNKLFRPLFFNPANAKGFSLEPGDYFKLGRVELRVLEIKTSQRTASMENQQTHGANEEIFQMKEKLEGSCKICLCDDDAETNPLVNPCKCKGHCGLIHLECLKTWINTKVKKQTFGRVLTYNFQKFSCQICEAPFPSAIRLLSGQESAMLIFQKPLSNYMMMEQCCQTQKMEGKTIHFVMPTNQSGIKLGRGTTCQLSISDISVSRNHALITLKDNEFQLFDTNSKFGTLVEIRDSLEIRQKVRVQFNGCYFDLMPVTMSKKQKKYENENENEMPMCPTQFANQQIQQLP